MDYVLFEAQTPDGFMDKEYLEKIIYLPMSFPFKPFEPSPSIEPLPALSNGYLSFGVFNSPKKYSSTSINLWIKTLNALPTSKIVFGGEMQHGKWSVGLRQVFFGRMQTLGFGWSGLASQRGTGGPGDPAISGNFLGIDPYVDIDGFNDQVNVLPEVFNYSAKSTTDIYGNVRLSGHIQLSIGVDNIFNAHPDYAGVPQARYQSFVNETGGPWESVQMGFNGTRFYSRLKVTF
jgi:outer membrane receptor protein involved in Fe transport